MESETAAMNFLYSLDLVLMDDFTQRVKNLPAVQGNQVQSLDWEDPLEKGKATHSGVPAWRIHGQRSLAGYSPWGQRVRHDQVTNTHTLLTVHLRFIFLCVSEDLFLSL